MRKTNIVLIILALSFNLKAQRIKSYELSIDYFDTSSVNNFTVVKSYSSNGNLVFQNCFWDGKIESYTYVPLGRNVVCKNEHSGIYKTYLNDLLKIDSLFFIKNNL